jgi:membrane-associated PAP2 superfamily phosphatase
MGGRTLFIASWVLLAILAALVAFLSINSTMRAFGGAPDALTPAYSIADLATVSPDAVTAVHGRRVTASTWALGYALLHLFVVLVPYRRGERWAWWALLVSLGVSQLLSIARIPALGTNQGAAASGILLAFLLIGLLAGAPRMFAKERET